MVHAADRCGSALTAAHSWMSHAASSSRPSSRPIAMASALYNRCRCKLNASITIAQRKVSGGDFCLHGADPRILGIANSVANSLAQSVRCQDRCHTPVGGREAQERQNTLVNRHC